MLPLPLPISAFLPSIWCSFAVNRCFAFSSSRLDGPVLDRVERADLALALHDEPQRDGLHSTRGDALLDRLPEHRTGLVTHETIQHATRLLRFHLLVVDLARLLNGELHGVLRDLMKEHAPNGHDRLAALRLDLLARRATRWPRPRDPGRSR